MVNQHAVSQYAQVNAAAGVAEASPHRLVQMLMEGCLQRIAEAKGALQRREVARKGEAIGKAVSIIGGLREGLNLEAGDEVIANLDSLYDYMQRQLVTANMRNDEQLLEEVTGLMHTIKDGWDGIAPAPQKAP